MGIKNGLCRTGKERKSTKVFYWDFTSILDQSRFRGRRITKRRYDMSIRELIFEILREVS